MATKMGEVQLETTGDIKTADELKVQLRVGWTDKVKEVTFKPLAEIKSGSKVKVTLEVV